MRREMAFIAILLGSASGTGTILAPMHSYADERARTAEDDAEKPDQTIRRMEQRIRKLERALKKARDQSSSPRYQLQVVDGRAIVLDTHTGEARIIDPTDDASKQRVEIGKSWITVTVLVNAAKENSRQLPPQPGK